MARRRNRTNKVADRLIRHQIYLQRYSPTVVRKMTALIERTDAKIVERLARYAGTADALQLDSVLRSIRKLHDDMTGELKARLTGEMSDFAMFEAGFAKDLAKAETGFSFGRVSMEQVRAAAMSRPFQGPHLKWAELGEHVDEYGARRGALIRDTIRQAYIQGDGIAQLVTQLRGTEEAGFEDGLMAITERAAEAIARTSVNHIGNAAREELYKAAPDLITKVQWVSVIDGRTSAVCRARDGEVYEMDKGPRPPAHPNCRSLTVPIFEGEEDFGRTTYGGWLQEQPRTDVDDILGKDKATLFLEGGLTLDRFVDSKGHEYSLDVLRQREADAFKRAGLT